MLLIVLIAGVLFAGLVLLNSADQGKAVANRYCLSECTDERYHSLNSIR